MILATGKIVCEYPSLKSLSFTNFTHKLSEKKMTLNPLSMGQKCV